MRLLAEIGLVALAAVGVAVSVALLPDGRSSRRHRGSAGQASRPEQLVALERLVSGATTSTLHVHAYLRPLLAEIAARRLAARGRALERLSEPDGRQLLGGSLWEIIRPDKRIPEDRHAAGVSAEELGAILEVLERL